MLIHHLGATYAENGSQRLFARFRLHTLSPHHGGVGFSALGEPRFDFERDRRDYRDLGGVGRREVCGTTTMAQ